VRSLAERAPVLLAIDDLQWANSSTLNLFGLLSMRFHHHPVMLVGTVQHAEAIPALQRLITLGRRRGELHLYSLTPLKVEAVATLLGESGVDSTSVEALAKWLHERSGGNPFLLTEVLAQIRADAILQHVGAGWQLDTSRWLRWRVTFTLPERTHDLVSWRLASLSTDARRVLDVLAVAGQPLPLPILREFPGIPDGSFLSLVEDLEARGLVSERPTATLALPHHLLRETLLHRMSNFYLRRIHKQLAEVMEAYVSPEDDAWLRQIALHAVAGEDVDRARRYGLRVLDNLSQEYTGAETVDFVNQLYDLLAPTASAVESFRLTRALGVLNQSLGRIKTAAHWHRQNLDWAQKAGDIAAQAETCFEMSELALMTNDYQAAIKTAQEGLSKLNDGSRYHQNHLNQPLFGRGHRLLGAAFAMEGSDLATAEDHLRLAAIAHQEAGNPGDLCSALFELGNISAQRGELMRALDYYAESARAAEDGHIYYYLALAHNNFAYHSLLLGQIENAQRSAAQGLKVAEANDLLAALLHLYSTRGEIHLYLAEWNEAEGSFRRGLALAEDLGSLERQAGYRGGLALAARGREDLDRANHLLAEAITLIEDQGFWHLRTRLQLWLAETLFERSEFTRAAQLLDTAIDIARAQDRTLLLVQGERLRARLLASEGDWLAANSLFAKTLEIANDLGIPLEIARVQAAWGEAAVYHSPDPEEGHSLLEAARPVLSAHKALADLATLAEV
jgi:tetratricopeptide (TPR) repeat protein